MSVKVTMIIWLLGSAFMFPKASAKRSKKGHCSHLSVGAYKLTKRNGVSWTSASTKIHRPSLSPCTFLISIWRSLLKRIRTPLLWVVPCENNILPSHWNFHWFSISRELYVSCRKAISTFCFLIHVKIALRLWKSRIPRAFKDKSLKL